MKSKYFSIFLLLLALTPMINGVSEDFWTEVMKGNIPGHSGIKKFGHNEALSTNFETIWSGSNLYTYPVAATFMNLTSSDVDDTNGGSGAWNVTIYGLDANYNMINETITLNGQTPVISTLQYLRVWRMIVQYSGASDYNEGTIYFGTGATAGGVPTNIYAMIDPEYSQTYMTQYTVPNGYTAYIVAIDGTCFTVNKNFEIYLRYRPIGKSWIRREEWHLPSGSSIPYSDKIAYTIPSMADIEFMGKVDVAGGITEIHYDVLLVKDGYETIYDNVETTNNTLLYIVIIILVVLLLASWRK